MVWSNTLNLISCLLAAIVSAGLALIAWFRRQNPGSAAFAWFMLSVTATALPTFFQLTSQTTAEAAFWFNATFFGLAGLPVAWLVFALYYAGHGRWLTNRRLAIFLAIPVITQVMIWTNGWHGFWFQALTFRLSGELLVLDRPHIIPGIWFWIYTTYAYLTCFVAVVLIAQTALSSRKVYRDQAIGMIAGVLLPMIANILFVFQPWPGLNLNLTILGMAIGGLCFAWSMLRYGLLELVPLARSTLVENLIDGMLVLDVRRRVVDLNPALANLLDRPVSELVGKPAIQALLTWPELLNCAVSDDCPGLLSYRGTAPGVRFFDMNVQEIARADGSPAGRLLMLREVTRLVEVEQALRKSATELEARNQELDAFVHTVAHDLKSPLSAVIGHASLLSGLVPSDGLGTFPQEAIIESLQAISDTSIKLNRIINELLLLASVRQQDVQIQPIDMEYAVSSAIDRLRVHVESSGAQIELPTHWPLARGYEPWVEEVWMNYLSNALKYGGQPPLIVLGAECQPDGMLRFWVRDNGRGLSREEQRSLFTPYTRLDQVRAEGHGLGLSIVRRIVERLGGQVGVESVPGEGSTFYFTLPSKNGKC